MQWGSSAVFRFWYCCDCSYFFQVLVTVPLALLQKNAIQFNPPLSEKKIKAINSLGAGVIEKVSDFILSWIFFSYQNWLFRPCCVCSVFIRVYTFMFYLHTVAQESKMLLGITCISVAKEFHGLDILCLILINDALGSFKIPIMCLL